MPERIAHMPSLAHVPGITRIMGYPPLAYMMLSLPVIDIYVVTSRYRYILSTLKWREREKTAPATVHYTFSIE